MSDETFEAFKIRRAPNGKFYLHRDGEAICLLNGNLRYFTTEREARAFLADGERAGIDRFAA
jgi:hypothetical protein